MMDSRDQVRFQAEMALIADLPADVRAMIGVHRRCLVCGNAFLAFGSDEDKQSSNVCEGPVCQQLLKDAHIRPLVAPDRESAAVLASIILAEG